MARPIQRHVEPKPVPIRLSQPKIVACIRQGLSLNAISDALGRRITPGHVPALTKSEYNRLCRLLGLAELLREYHLGLPVVLLTPQRSQSWTLVKLILDATDLDTLDDYRSQLRQLARLAVPSDQADSADAKTR